MLRVFGRCNYFNNIIFHCSYLSTISPALPTNEISLKKTVFLPKTTFQPRIKSELRSSLDGKIFEAGKFKDYYYWQKNDDTRKTFPKFHILDGPPYANGNVHVGHSVNKILKDFILKSKSLLGYRVTYRPGWDCHGLPIELKITKNKKSSDPLEIRKNAREVANSSIEGQKNAFIRWGVSGEWDSPYKTMDPNYVSNELKILSKLYEKGLISRSYKPVYYSPSTGTALAEAELEYNEEHISKAVYYRFPIINQEEVLKNQSGKDFQIYGLIWTTTPWTLPLNNAIAFSKKFKYLLIEPLSKENHAAPVKGMYIITESLLNEVSRAFGNCELKIHQEISSDILSKLVYKSCSFPSLGLPFLEASYVTDNMGTGLVHVSFAHGFNDFNLGKEKKLDVDCFVDDNGCYTRHLGYELEGKNVLTDGCDAALQKLKKDVIFEESYRHSYPYDWRSKKPVIIRACEQWFIDISKISKKAIEKINNNEVIVNSGGTNLASSLVGILNNRPSWCISRQRHWGVPIPSVRNIETNEIKTSKELIKKVGKLIEEKSNTDVWWSMKLEDILDDKVSNSLNITKNDKLEKGYDILDVWFDSGVAWHMIKQEFDSDKTDVVLEGLDQFRGWFQSLLLTSLAYNDKIPYKNILVHGFTVDDDGKKMSKSLGNIIDPSSITDGSLNRHALGADGLRLWVAVYGSDKYSSIKIGPSTLEELGKKIGIYRNALKFVLGCLMQYKEEVVDPQLNVLDQRILNDLNKYLDTVDKAYRAYSFGKVVAAFDSFISNFSSNYISLVRDRIYCDQVNSPSHNAAIYTLDKVGTSLCHSISPILPHLSTEFFMHHPLFKMSPEVSLRTEFNKLYANGNLFKIPNLEKTLAIIGKIYKLAGLEASKKRIDVTKKCLCIKLPQSSEEINFISDIPSSQLSEIFGVSQVSLVTGNIEKLKNNIEEIECTFKDADGRYCSRCRKYTNFSSNSLCDRCFKVVDFIVKQS
uniref:isoleucine--tRNA ligase n=1 Tax=Parastrongyloides trichosuri TaxID=131310 RepID=A0A0N5A4X4_PARTI